jgi:membrane glycosyltransferase
MVVPMDARVKLDVAAPLVALHLAPDVPPEAPLSMPQQAVSAARRRVFGERDGRWRLAAVLGPAFALTALAGLQSWRAMSADGMAGLEWLALGLFVLNLAWVSGAAATAIAGALVLWARPEVRETAKPFVTSSKTAIVFPVYNEQPARVTAAAQAVYDALARERAADAFEIFFLSDTTDAAIAREEEVALARLRESRPEAKIFYRRRVFNHGRKAGNIAEFVRRWGGRYDYMVVFDADSLMSASSLMQLVQRMDMRPRTALVQTLPATINAQTLFARSQQFAMRAYGQIFGAGLAWWSGGAGNFWGHNAIVRVRAFAAHAGLPVLPGKGPLGGHIMSHDFVEAALLRRAGWRVEIAPDISGSFEECPPTLVDMAARDRRWAQGNLQHVALLGARGFHPVSRAHMLAGVMGYLSAPMWFALIVSSIALAWMGHGGAGEADTTGGGGGSLFFLTAMIVLSTKWLAAALWLAGRLPDWSRHPRFLGGLMVETVVSALVAPIMMVNQTMAIISTLTGVDAGWRPQVRERSGGSIAELSGHYAVHLVAGAALFLAALAHDPMLAAWTSPVALSLVFAAPISAALSRAPRTRSWLWRVMSTPEEAEPPSVVRAARRAALRFGGTRPAPAAEIRLPATPIPLPARPIEIELPQAGG